MQTFKDTATGQYYQFDDDVVMVSADGARKFYAPHDINTPLNVPGTLVPAELPAPAPMLEQAQTLKTAELSAACQADIYSGFHSTALGADHLYPFNVTDQRNLSDSVLASTLPGRGTDWTTPFWCADSAGVWAMRLHTATQIQQVGDDAMARKLACMTQNDTLSGQVMAATTIEAVEAIAWAI